MERMGRSRRFQDVEVWKKMHAWVLAVYRFTESWPRGAQTSLDESEYCLILGRDLNYGDSQALLEGAEEIGRMLEGYITSMLRARDHALASPY